MRSALDFVRDWGWQPPVSGEGVDEWDVIVVGAGPAGSIAAASLARSGYRVLLLDGQKFPRDKTCGDALIPDSLKVLERSRLLPEILKHGNQFSVASVFSPSKIEVPIPGQYVTLKRRVLDALLARRAVADGAAFRHGAVSAIVTEPDGSLSFVVNGRQRPFRARVGILATGANVTLLEQTGMLERTAPSAIAMRCYITAAERLDQLVVSYDRSIAPGYAWIFPVGEREYNVGCGIFYRRPQHRKVNLREMFQHFLEEFPLARRLRDRMLKSTPLIGAPLRCSLTGTRVAGRGALVAIGEAIGATFPFTGEGVGKAMETAELAAKAIHAAFATGNFELLRQFPARLAAELRPRYRGYEIAERWLSKPWVSDLIARRAARSESLRRLISGILNETVDPGSVFCLRGVLRALVG
ncbi:MAG: geranylgeranyl reductase family protein [Bryobacteraceae bacterium]